MKAVVHTEYGAPEVLRLEEADKPTPGDDEVLVSVHAASVNPLDWHIMRGAPFFVRFEAGFPKPKNTILGADIAGRVEAVGKGVTQIQPGDEVFGDVSGSGLGGFAEYVCAREAALAPKPSNLSFEEAAALPVAAVTALQGLRNKGQVRAGQRVLVNGASGGVGTFAVQLAKNYGAEVTGVCSTRNLELVRSIGADRVVDYTKEDFTQTGQQYDLILDVVGNRSVSDCARTLDPQGKCVVVGFTTLFHLLQVVSLGSWVSRRGPKKIGLLGVAKPNQKDLLFIKELIEAGKVAPVIDRTYSLSEVPEAIGYLEKGHARGKVVISIQPS